MGIKKEKEQKESVIVKVFTNEESLKNARTFIVALVVIVAPMLYFVYNDSLTLEKILSFQFGGLSLIVAVSAFMANKETRKRAFENSYDMDSELEELEQEYEDNGDKIQKKDKSLKSSTKFIHEYNKEQQELYNQMKTDTKIAKLEPLVVKHRLDGNEKKANKIEKQIDRLKQEPLFDNKFVPYEPNLIVNASENKQWRKRKKKGNKEIDNDPKRVNPISQVITTVTRGFTGGLAGTLLISFTDPFSTIFWFYVTYFAIMSFTVITGYSLTVYKTLRSYKHGLKKKIKIQELLLEYLNKPYSYELQTIEEGKNE